MNANYLTALVDYFLNFSNPDKAKAQSQYMRNQFRFIGISSPSRGHLLSSFFNNHGIPAIEDLEELIVFLWSRPERDFQYIAISVLRHYQDSLTVSHLSLIEAIILSKPWWDTIDSIAPNLVGSIFYKNLENTHDHIQKWMLSDNIWLQRSVILHQLKYKTHTNKELLFGCILFCSKSNEFFIQKAIGWSLREFAKTDPDSVRDFVRSNRLSPLSKREALKNLR